MVRSMAWEGPGFWTGGTREGEGGPAPVPAVGRASLRVSVANVVRYLTKEMGAGGYRTPARSLLTYNGTPECALASVSLAPLRAVAVTKGNGRNERRRESSRPLSAPCTSMFRKRKREAPALRKRDLSHEDEEAPAADESKNSCVHIS